MRTFLLHVACLLCLVAASPAEESAEAPAPGTALAAEEEPDAADPGGEVTWNAREAWQSPAPGTSDLPGLPLPAEAGQESPEPETPEAEVRTLGDYGIAYTTRALQSGAQFYPFAFVMRHDGAIQRLAPSEMPRFPTQEELLETLVAGLAEEEVHRKYKAVAIVVDVVIAMPGGRESEAIQLGLEHESGFCRNVFYPYTLSEEGRLKFEKPLSGKRRSRIFGRCD